MSSSEGTKRLDDVVVRQIQTKPNKRMLSRMPSFRVSQETPQAMLDLLRQMDMAEARARASRNSQTVRRPS